MKKFGAASIIDEQVLVTCGDEECAGEDGLHAYSKADILASIATTIEDLASVGDPRIDTLDAALTLLWQDFYPTTEKPMYPPEESDFAQEYERTRAHIDVILETLDMNPPDDKNDLN